MAARQDDACGNQKQQPACEATATCAWGRGRCRRAKQVLWDRFVRVCRSRRGRADLVRLLEAAGVGVPRQATRAELCDRLEAAARAPWERHDTKGVRDILLRMPPPDEVVQPRPLVAEATLLPAEQRIARFRQMTALLRRESSLDKCTLTGLFEKHTRIGTPSVYGRAFRVTHERLPAPVALKVMKDNPANRAETRYYRRLGKEVVALRTPHFPLITSVSRCGSCVGLDVPEGTRCMVVFSELANGDLRSWLEGGKRDRAQVCSMMAQVLIIGMSLERLGLVHHDLHWGNLLYHADPSQAGAYIHYVFGERHVYVRHMGALWVLWDMGMMAAARPGVTTATVDMPRIFHFPEWCKKQGFPNRFPAAFGSGLRAALMQAATLWEAFVRVPSALDAPYQAAWGSVVVIDPPAAWVAEHPIWNPHHPFAPHAA